MRTLAIVTGDAAGKLGRALRMRLESARVTCVGVARRSAPGVMVVDLFDRAKVAEAISHIQFCDFERVLIAHAVGAFKFEPYNTETVRRTADPAIIASSVATFRNLVDAVWARKGDLPVSVLCVGSLAENWNVPCYHSYTVARRIVRQQLRSMTAEGVGAVYAKLSTVRVPSERALRPCADDTYWLSPEQFAERVAPFLLAVPRGRYIEVDVNNQMPGFDPYEQYADYEAVLNRWRHDMGNDAFERAMRL